MRWAYAYKNIGNFFELLQNYSIPCLSIIFILACLTFVIIYDGIVYTVYTRAKMLEVSILLKIVPRFFSMLNLENFRYSTEHASVKNVMILLLFWHKKWHCKLSFAFVYKLNWIFPYCLADSLSIFEYDHWTESVIVVILQFMPVSLCWGVCVGGGRWGGDFFANWQWKILYLISMINSVDYHFEASIVFIQLRV